jgi:hypothetical protein
LPLALGTVEALSRVVTEIVSMLRERIERETEICPTHAWS